MDKLFSMVEIEINSECNRKCWYCPNSKYSRKHNGEMSIDMFKELMYQLKCIQFKGRISYHFYNEPLICSNLDIFIKISKQYLPTSRQVLYTNGDFLDEERFKHLIDIGIDYFVVTQHVGKTSKFTNIVSTLPNDLLSKVKYIDNTELNLTNRGGIIEQVGLNNYENVKCCIPKSLIVVTATGNVIPCFEDYNEELIMGNITQNNIIDIWETEKYTEFRKNINNGQRFKYTTCSKCNNYSIKDDIQFDYIL